MDVHPRMESTWKFKFLKNSIAFQLKNGCSCKNRINLKIKNFNKYDSILLKYLLLIFCFYNLFIYLMASSLPKVSVFVLPSISLWFMILFIMETLKPAFYKSTHWTIRKHLSSILFQKFYWWLKSYIYPSQPFLD